jgi:hypothetical protein
MTNTMPVFFANIKIPPNNVFSVMGRQYFGKVL